MATLPAVVTIQDLPTGTTLSGTELLEAVQTVGGVAISIQVPINQIATTALGGLPTGGGTGQILDKASGTNFAAQWVNLSTLLAAGTSLSVSGSTTVTFGVSNFGIRSAQIATNAVGNVQFRQGSPISVIGVAGSATANVADVTASGGGQILQTNAGGTGIVWGSFSTTLLPGPFQVSSFTQNGVIYGNGTSALGATASGTAAWPLVGNGTALAPSFSVLTVPGGGIGTTVLGAFGVVLGNGSSSLGVAAAGTTAWPLVANGTALAPTFAILTVPGGGVGTTSLAAFGVIFGNGTAALGAVTAGTTGWPLLANGTLSAPSFQQINLGSASLTGVLGVPSGGTNTSTLTANGVLFGNGSSTLGITAAGATSSLLMSNGTAPIFTTSPKIGTSLIIGNIGTTNSSTVVLAISANATSPPSTTAPGGGMWLVAQDGAVSGYSVDGFGANSLNIFRRADGTAGVPAALANGASIGGFRWDGYNGAAYAPTKGQLIVSAAETWNATSNGTNLSINLVRTGQTSVSGALLLWGGGGLSIGATAVLTNPGLGGGRFDGVGTFLGATGLATVGTSAILISSVASFGIFVGTGVPSVIAGTGSIFLRNDGATATSRMYINSNGSTAWVAVNTVS